MFNFFFFFVNKNEESLLCDAAYPPPLTTVKDTKGPRGRQVGLQLWQRQGIGIYNACLLFYSFVTHACVFYVHVIIFKRAE